MRSGREEGRGVGGEKGESEDREREGDREGRRGGEREVRAEQGGQEKEALPQLVVILESHVKSGLYMQDTPYGQALTPPHS